MTKEQAESIGRDMLKQLGEGWKISVFQNLGWHVNAYKGTIHVSAARSGPELITYFCLISDRNGDHSTGSSVWSGNNHADFDNPVDAVIYEVQKAMKVVRGLNSILADAEQAIENFNCKCCGKKRYEKS